jgi:phage repressor protein C with HTH and peptisase S24 domain
MNQRERLDQLITERREDFAGLSRLLGRNPAYVQQFIKRGSPKRLSEADARKLASYFGVPPEDLGVDTSTGDAPAGLVLIRRYDLGASAGFGALDASERPVAHFGFDRARLRGITRSSPEALSLIRVEGDSMEPTLADGDDILVDQADSQERVRDGVYVLRRDDALVVKRIAVHPGTGRITVSSDNPSYPRWTDCDPKDLRFIGRVVWAGRKIR